MGVSDVEEVAPLLLVRKNEHSSNGLLNNGNKWCSNDYGAMYYKDAFPYSISEGSGSSGSGSPDIEKSSKGCARPITYTWHDIHVKTSGTESQRQRLWRQMRNAFGSDVVRPQKKHILHGVHGAAYPGELMALMGASGAGKTSLMNVLTFRSSDSLEVTGLRCINGVPVQSNELASISAYVQQVDLFIGTLTVREHLVFQALVRMDRHIPYNQRMARVSQVISELALKKCENTIIGIPGRIKGISGGEMKRLSFASEVLTDPPLMFCDEPTSGLDSFMAQNVVSVLKSMAMKGKTVVATIHQPSSEVFSMFDKVLLMAEGKMAYLGTPADACTFFNDLGAACPSNYNPADFFIQLLAVVPNKEESCRETIGLVCDAFDRSEAGIKLASDTEFHPQQNGKGFHHGWSNFDMSEEGSDWTSIRRPSPYKASWWAQFRAVLWRSWLSVIKDPLLINVRLLQSVLVAVLISVLYFQQDLTQDGVMNINGAMFLFLTNMSFQNVFSVINVFCSEIPVFMREHFNGMYRVDVYFLCKTFAEFPVFVAIPIIFISVAYYAIGLYPSVGHFFVAMLVLVLVANVALSFGYMISCLSSSTTVALSIASPLIIPFLLFGGFFLNAESVPSYFEWLSLFSWFRYGNEALLINQWANVDSIDCSQSLTNTTCPRNGTVVLKALGFDQSDFAMDIWCLIFLIVFFRLIAYCGLLFRASRKN